MVRTCSIARCKNTDRDDKNSDITFHIFPLKNKEVLTKWISATKRKNFKPTKKSVICSVHFTENDFLSKERTQLHHTAVPTILKKNKTEVKREKRTMHKKILETPPVIPEVNVEKELLKVTDKFKTTEELFVHLSNLNFLPSFLIDLLQQQFAHYTIEKIILNPFSDTTDIPQEEAYIKSMRDFSLCLYFSSLQVFQYLSKMYNLPNETYLLKWITTKDCLPGFFEEIFEEISKGGHKKLLEDSCLMIDTLEIEKEYVHDHLNDEYLGSVNVAGVPVMNSNELATEVLVLYLSSVTGNFKCPLGYFLISSLPAETLAQLIRACIIKINAIGLTIHTIVCNGFAFWLDVFKILGCSFEGGLTTFFHLDSNKYDIFIIFDSFNLLNLCCDTLEQRKIRTKNGLADFKFIKRFSERINEIENNIQIDISQKSYLCKINLLLKSHIISTEIAEALQFLLENKDPLFVDCGPTVTFLKILSKLYEIFNYKNYFLKDHCNPVTVRNIADWDKTLDEIFYFITTLKINNLHVLLHPRKTFALGMMINIISIKSLACRLIKNQILNVLLPYIFSLDHLDYFFTRLKSRIKVTHLNSVQFRKALMNVVNHDIGVFNTTIKYYESIPLKIKYFRRFNRSVVSKGCLYYEKKAEQNKKVYTLLNNSSKLLFHDIFPYFLSHFIGFLVGGINCTECVSLLFADDSYLAEGEVFVSGKEASRDLIILIQIIERQVKLSRLTQFNKTKLVNSVLNEAVLNHRLFFSHSLNAEIGELHDSQLIVYITTKYIRLRHIESEFLFTL